MRCCFSTNRKGGGGGGEGRTTTKTKTHKTNKYSNRLHEVLTTFECVLYLQHLNQNTYNHNL